MARGILDGLAWDDIFGKGAQPKIQPLQLPTTAMAEYERQIRELQNAHRNAHRSGLADALQYGVGISTPKRNFSKNYGTNIMSMLSEDKAYQLMAMRLRVPEGNRFPADHLSLHVTDKKAFVFLVNKGQATTLEDDPDLFPSDQLITQIRLLIG